MLYDQTMGPLCGRCGLYFIASCTAEQLWIYVYYLLPIDFPAFPCFRVPVPPSLSHVCLWLLEWAWPPSWVSWLSSLCTPGSVHSVFTLPGSHTHTCYSSARSISTLIWPRLAPKDHYPPLDRSPATPASPSGRPFPLPSVIINPVPNKTQCHCANCSVCL